MPDECQRVLSAQRSFHRVVQAGARLEDFKVDPAVDPLEVFAGRLTAWAMEVLKDFDREQGMYSAELSTLDDCDEPDKYIYAVTMC